MDEVVDKFIENDSRVSQYPSVISAQSGIAEKYLNSMNKDP